MMLPLIVSIALAQYTADEARALFSEANSLSISGHADEAVERYEKLIAANRGGADVFYNLGSTYLAVGKIGLAIVNLERAIRLSSDDDIEANLAIARQKQSDQLVGESTSRPFLERLADAVDERALSIVFLITWFTGFGLLMANQLGAGKRSMSRIVATIVTMTMAIAAGLGIVGHSWVRLTVHEAVVTAEVVKVREFPDSSGRVAFEIHDGLKLRILETSGPYARIRLPNALEGWVENNALTRL